MWIEWNPNPSGRRVGDCAVRAVAKALNTDWESAYAAIVVMGYALCDMPSSNAVWGAVLRQHGFYRDCYTAEDFCRDHPEGVYVLVFSGHVATVENGSIYDSWDSSQEIPMFYWHEKKG